MSCFPGLGRSLKPARKLLKSISSKLDIKLHNLNKSKSIKKHKNPSKPTSSRTPLLHPRSPFKLLRRSHHKNRLDTAPSTGHKHNHHRHESRRIVYQPSSPPSIYIEDLLSRQTVATACSPSERSMVEAFHRTGGGSKVLRQKDRAEDVHAAEELRHVDEGKRTEEKGGGAAVEEAAVDEAWESVALASPLLRGIDERAEEFIAKFRAELESQRKMDCTGLLINGQL